MSTPTISPTTRLVGGMARSNTNAPPIVASANNFSSTTGTKNKDHHLSSTRKVLRIRTQDDATAIASAKLLLDRSILFLTERGPPSLHPSSSSSLYAVSTSSSSWTDDDLKQASDILNALSKYQQHQGVPKELLLSWIAVMDDLLCCLLVQYQSTDDYSITKQSSSSQPQPQHYFPDSNVFSSIITLYSKSRINLASNNNRNNNNHQNHHYNHHQYQQQQQLQHSNYTVAATSATTTTGAAERAEFWLHEMIRLSRDYPNLVSTPRGSLFASVLGAWERSAPNPIAIQHGENLWRQLQEHQQEHQQHSNNNNNNNNMVVQSAYYLYLSLWCKSIDANNPTKAPTMAEQILRQMIIASRTNSKIVPTLPAFVNVISCWRRAGQEQHQYHHHHHPSSSSSSDNIQKKPQDVVPYRAQAVLDLLLSEHERRSKLPQKQLHMEVLNDRPFNPTILAWASSNLPQAEQQIDTIIHTTMPNVKVVPTIITTWSALPVYDKYIEQLLSSHTSTRSTTTTITSTPSPTLVYVPAKILSLMEYVDNRGSNQNPMLVHQVYSKAIDIVCRFASISAHHPDNKSSSTSIDADDGGAAAAPTSAVNVADEILQRYLDLPKEDRRISVTMESFERVIEAWKVHYGSARTQQQEQQLTSTKTTTTMLMPSTSIPPSQKQQHDKGDGTGSERIVYHLERMEQEAERIYGHKHSPSVFASVASAWAKSGAPNSIGKTEDYVNRLLDSGREQRPHNPLRRGWLQRIIRAVKENSSKDESEEFMKRISRRLATSSQLYQMIEDTTSPDEQFGEDVFGGILDYLAKSGDHNAGQRAEIILLKMQEVHDAGGTINSLSSPPPTFETFQMVLTCWSNSQDDGAAQRADDVLLLAETLYDAGDVRLRPTLEGYMSVVNAWSQSHSPDAPDKIQRHLKRIQRLKSSGEIGYDLDDSVYAALINAYANSGRTDSNIMAQAIFDATPEEYKTVAVYNAFICAQGGDSNKAEATLQMMQYEYMEQNNVKIKPNTETFNSVLLVWLRSASPMAAWRADGIFKRMIDLTDSGQLDVRPNSRTFDLIISTLAQDWVAELRKVDRYLELLKEYYQSGAPDCVPTVTSYTEAIRAWGSNNDDGRAMLRAKALLDEMHELARDGVDSVRPNRRTYEVYLRALSRSPIEGRVELAADVLAQMKTNNVDVDVELQPYIQRCMVNFEKHVHASDDI
jgi:hypothetical protein